MGRRYKGKSQGHDYTTLAEIQRNRGNIWYHHYLNYLCSLTYQLIEWEGLPDTIDPRYLEMNLHRLGYVGFFKDEDRKSVV